MAKSTEDPANVAPAAKTSRRALLRGAIVGMVLVSAGGVAAWCRTSGYSLPKERAAELRHLEAWQFVLLQHLARRICAGDRPDAPSADDVDVAGFLDSYLGQLPSRITRDLKRFFAYIEHVAPLGAKHLARFTELGAEDQDQVLANLESSSQELLCEGFAGLKALVFIGYYRDARTWKVIGYPGPLVGLRASERLILRPGDGG